MARKTEELDTILKSTQDTRDLEAYLEDIDGQETDFNMYVNSVLLERNLSIAELQRQSQIARTYMYQIMDGTRNPGRDKVIAICLALEFDLPVTMRLLKSTGNAVLYSKNRRDSVIIYAISHGLSVAETNKLLDNYGQDRLQ